MEEETAMQEGILHTGRYGGKNSDLSDWVGQLIVLHIFLSMYVSVCQVPFHGYTVQY